MFDAKQNFSKIIEAVNTSNKMCVISKSGKEIGPLTPLNRVTTRKMGFAKMIFNT